MITTKGFKEIYEIGRANRPEIYNFRYKRQKTLLSRSDIFEIDERIGPDAVSYTHLTLPTSDLV